MELSECCFAAPRDVMAQAWRTAGLIHSVIEDSLAVATFVDVSSSQYECCFYLRYAVVLQFQQRCTCQKLHAGLFKALYMTDRSAPRILDFMFGK